MRAAIRRKYGPPEVVELADVDKPELADDAVLVRVRAASLNRLDWYSLTGRPYIVRPQFGFSGPRDPRIGVDFSGVAEAVGKDVTHVRPGDEVFGGRPGAFAEYVSVKKSIVPKPAGVSFEEAAAVPVAGVTALQGLRDKAQVQPGQHVLVNGASGGVGTFAVQIAKHLGAEVTAVCSTRNVEIARSLGADRVFDYTRDDFTRDGERYDVIFDVAGSRSWRESKRVLKPQGLLVQAGAPKGGRVLGPLKHIGAVRMAALGSKQKVLWFTAQITREDLTTLGELIASGRVKPYVEQRFELSETADALRLMGEGHVRGKLVIAV